MLKHISIFRTRINELRNLQYLPRLSEAREIMFEDRTKAHADHVGHGHDRMTTAAVGKIENIIIFIHKNKFKFFLFILRNIKSCLLWNKRSTKSYNKRRCCLFSQRFSSFGWKITIRFTWTTNFTVCSMGWRCKIESIETSGNSLLKDTIVWQWYLFFAKKYYSSVSNCYIGY